MAEGNGMIDVRSKPCANAGPGHRFVAWGKWGRIKTGCPVREPGDVWFDYGDTPEDAEAKVRAEIESAPRGHDGRPFFYPESTLPGSGERLRDAIAALQKALRDALSPIGSRN